MTFKPENISFSTWNLALTDEPEVVAYLQKVGELVAKDLTEQIGEGFIVYFQEGNICVELVVGDEMNTPFRQLFPMSELTDVTRHWVRDGWPTSEIEAISAALRKAADEIDAEIAQHPRVDE